MTEPSPPPSKHLAITEYMWDLISHTPDSNSIYNGVLDVIYKMLGFEYAIISVVDWNRHTIEAKRGIWNGKADCYPEWLQKVSYSLDDRDILTFLVRYKKAIVLDGWDDLLNREIFDRFHHENLVRAFVPIVGHDNKGQPIVLGTIEAGCHRSLRSAVSPEDLECLKFCASQAARAIQVGIRVDGITLDNLAESAKLSEQFVRLIAHETRGVRATIGINVGLIRECLPKEPDQHILDSLKALESAATYLARFEAAFDFGLLKREHVAVRDVLKTAMEVAAPPRNVSLAIGPQPDPMIVDCNPTILQTAFVNLFRNAYEAIAAVGGHGSVTVSFDCANRSTLHILVSDTGCGVRPDMAERICKQIASTKRHSGGIGLFIPAMALRMMDAELEFLPKASSKGATFRITLPVPLLKGKSKKEENLSAP
jgi:signal transduction histidine kinase